MIVASLLLASVLLAPASASAGALLFEGDYRFFDLSRNGTAVVMSGARSADRQDLWVGNEDGLENRTPAGFFEGMESGDRFTTAKLSGDGKVVAASYWDFRDSYAMYEFGRVLSDGVNAPVVELGTLDFYSQIRGVDETGTVAVGVEYSFGDTHPGSQALIYGPGSTPFPVALPHPPGGAGPGTRYAYHGFSGDGQVLIGSWFDNTGLGSDGFRAGPVDRGFLGHSAVDVSQDGSVVVGAFRGDAYRTVGDSDAERLAAGTAIAVSALGDRVLLSEGRLWDETRGVLEVAPMLAALAASLGIEIETIDDMAYDGLTFAGTYSREGGGKGVYILATPEPSTGVLVALGLGLVVLSRREQRGR